MNVILDTDSYKSGHYLQYPKNTTKLVAYLESRGGVFEKTVFFGLQYILKKYLTQAVTDGKIQEAAEFFEHHKLPFNKQGWQHIAEKHQGKVPLSIFAAKEGAVIPIKNILMRVESTCSECFWVVTWFETMLLRVWYPTTVATVSWHMRSLIYKYLLKTADDPNSEVMFKLHDFGSRGVSSFESAGIGGAAHLVNFSGSDTIAGMLCANEFYQAKLTPSSIPAAEHSCIMVFSKEHEQEAYEYIIDRLSKKSSLIALPIDTYNIEAALNFLTNNLKQKILESHATVVLRLDSGNPVTNVLATVKMLEKAFGATKNTQGYKVLNTTRVLQSDQVNPQTIAIVLEELTQAGFSTSNIVFGMGGALLQQVNRDTQQFAYKVCLAEVNGKIIIPQKLSGTPAKHSKGGYLDLLKTENGYQTVDRLTHTKGESMLQKIFENGTLLVDQNLAEIRKHAQEV